MNRALLLILAFVTAVAMAQLRPQSIIVNPNPPTDLQVRIWVDKDPGKTGNPVYQFGEPIVISVSVTQPAYVYLFSVNSLGQISGILPNAFEQNNFLAAGEVRNFPSPGARYSFNVEPPAGQDRVLAVASRRPLDVSEIIDIQTGRARIQGIDNLARSLSIVVTPIPQQDWVSDEAYYIAQQVVAPPPPPPPALGTLVVDSNPSGADILINGLLRGRTPATFSLNPGNYTIELRRLGYQPYRTNVNIPGAGTFRVFANLQPEAPATGTLAISSNPSGAQVLIDGRVVGNTPLNLTLRPGRYTVVLRLGGYQDFRTSVVVQAGRVTNVFANLVAFTPPQPQPPIVVPVPPVPSGRITYVCEGGRLVVNWVSSNQVQVFYDNAFQTLGLVQTTPELVYSNNTYAWRFGGGVGSFVARGVTVRTGCRPQN